MAHQGIPDYTGDASSNISIVGTGFKMLNETDTSGGPTNTEAVFHKTGLGPDMIEDPSFDDSSYWDIPLGITVNAGNNSKAVFMSAINGRVLDPDTNVNAIAGFLYRVTFTIDSISTGGIMVGIGGAIGTTRTTAGTYTEDIKAGNTGYLHLKTVGTTAATIDNFSCKEVGGPYCIGIKNVGGTDASIQARSVIGDDLSQDGSYSKGAYTKYISFPYGDIIHGVFDRVAIEEPSSGTTVIQLIKGGE